MDADLNQKIFGWVNTSTTAVNNTLETFVEKTQNVLNETFGGTLLEEPVQELFECLIGLKIESVQKGLTWVHDNAHIDFPHLPNDTFSRGAQASISNDTSPSDSFLADAGDTTSNKITEVVQRVVDKMKDGLRTETLIATAILLLWVFIALVGILRAMTLFWDRDRNRGDGGGHAMDPVPNNMGPSNSGATRDTREFTDVPLTAIPRNELGFIQAVPRYETPVASSAQARAEASSSDEKRGFAGQRNYDSALKVDTDLAARKSNYVEYDVKRG